MLKNEHFFGFFNILIFIVFFNNVVYKTCIQDAFKKINILIITYTIVQKSPSEEYSYIIMSNS